MICTYCNILHACRILGKTVSQHSCSAGLFNKLKLTYLLTYLQQPSGKYKSSSAQSSNSTNCRRPSTLFLARRLPLLKGTASKLNLHLPITMPTTSSYLYRTTGTHTHTHTHRPRVTDRNTKRLLCGMYTVSLKRPSFIF